MGGRWSLAIILLVASFCAFYCGQISFKHILLANSLAIVFLNFKFFKVAVFTFPRDIIGIITLCKVQYALRKNQRLNVAVPTAFSKIVEQFNTEVAFVNADTGREWTFLECEQLANRVANLFSREGYRKGDVVTLYMTNCPEYVCTWLGLSKLGVVGALINYNLRAEPLGHSLNVANAKSIIVAEELLPALTEAIDDGHVTNRSTPIYVYGANDSTLLAENGLSMMNFRRALDSIPTSTPLVNDPPAFKDVLFYIYTSGTTGLPKAAIITHCRFMMMGIGGHYSFGIRQSDRIYLTMPLYHSAAGVLGVAQTLLHGSTCVIRKKFSASKFWDDCIQFDCTASQYIGEICRYLLAQPIKENDRRHNVRLMYGNGLRPQIWTQFVHRFGIKRIGEFYGSTEGNASLLNLDNHVGACGFLPIYPFLRPIYPVCLLKVEPDSGELIRNEKGLCVACRPGESGEVVGRIIRGDPLKDFTGYVSGMDTKKKVIRDVFTHGDAAFSSGDILYMDEKGYLFFRDRTGDTFRWKGENVSTTEVEAVLHKAVGLNDATVYGVEITNYEGKAGMAAIADENENVDLEHLQTTLNEKLPVYARPVFIRLCKKVDSTGTYKLKKTDLQKVGFDITQTNDDRLFYFDHKVGQYKPLSHDAYYAIQRGEISF